MKQTILNKLLNAVHIIFFTSILCFGITFLSGTLLMIPAFTAAFMTGRTLIYKEFDITDSVVKKYLHYLKEAMPLLRYDLFSIIFILNTGCITAVERKGISFYIPVCLCIAAFSLTVIIYLAGYYTFYNKEVDITEVMICMFYKPAFSLMIFSGMVLICFFFNQAVMMLFVFAGTVILFLLENVTFLHILYYKKFRGMLKGEEYASLVMTKEEKRKAGLIK